MSEELARAHILGQERLRALAAGAIAAAWDSLKSYDEENLEQWLELALPVATAAQRQAVALTELYLARSVRRQPLGVGRDSLVAAARLGADPEEVYRRPFVDVWTGLKNGKPWIDAVADGRRRAATATGTDVQLSMRETLREVGENDPEILGYERVPDGNACNFCVTVSGQRYRTDQLMPIHPNCGCSVDVITGANRADFTGKPENDLSVPGVAVHEHGELGPVLGDPAHDFTQLAA